MTNVTTSHGRTVFFHRAQQARHTLWRQCPGSFPSRCIYYVTSWRGRRCRSVFWPPSHFDLTQLPPPVRVPCPSPQPAGHLAPSVPTRTTSKVGMFQAHSPVRLLCIGASGQNCFPRGGVVRWVGFFPSSHRHPFPALPHRAPPEYGKRGDI